MNTDTFKAIMKEKADILVRKTLDSRIKGLWSNLQFQHKDAAGYWYTYVLRGQGQQTIRINPEKGGLKQ